MRRNRAFRIPAIAIPRPFSAAVLAGFAGLIVVASPPSVRAQAKPCTDAEPFRLEKLVHTVSHDLDQPLKMAFDRGEDGTVDIYFVERLGRVRKFDGKTGQVSTLGKPDALQTGAEIGLTGLALDPGFKSNRRLYLGHACREPAGLSSCVVRSTLDAAGNLDPASRKVVLAAPMLLMVVRSSITLRSGSDGDLFVGISENQSAEASSANTADLRGKILRIRPREDGGYDIPPGNLYPPGRDSTRPEIFVMGARQPYSLAWDHLRRRLAWGEFGPDATGARTEEHNVSQVPGFFGWPYFAGRHIPLGLGVGRDPAAILNVHPASKGLRALPPAVPAVHAYGQSGSVTGPLYHRPADAGPSFLPPGFDGLWFITDFNAGWVDTLRLDASGTAIRAQKRIPGLQLRHPVDFQQGPDGRLYAIEYVGSYVDHPDAAIVVLAYQGCAPTVGVVGGRKRIPATREYSRGPLRVTVGGEPRDIAGRWVHPAGESP